MGWRHMWAVVFVTGTVTVFAQGPAATERPAAQSAAAQPAPAAGTLPVRRVVLYKTGEAD